MKLTPKGPWQPPVPISQHIHKKKKRQRRIQGQQKKSLNLNDDAPEDNNDAVGPTVTPLYNTINLI